MGADIHVKIVQRDTKTDNWKQIKLYHKENGKLKIVKVYPFRNGELFDILTGKEDEYIHPLPLSIVHLPPSLKKEINYCQNTIGYYGFKEITLADLKLYLNQVPKIRDWEYEDNDPKAWKINPVKYFIDKIEQYIEMADPYWDFMVSPSNIKILYWFDC